MSDGTTHAVAVEVDDISREDAIRQLQNYHDLLIAAHLRRKHPYGKMRRDCPLCINIHNLGRNYEGAMQTA